MKIQDTVINVTMTMTELRALHRMIGASSPSSRKAMGLSDEESEAASAMYDILDAYIEGE